MKNRLLGRAIENGYRNLIRHPKWRWWVILGSLLYLVSPLDFLPDVFPVIGWIDDGLIATLAITEISQFLLENRRHVGRKFTPNSSEKAEEAVIDVPSVSVA
ncbi:MAG: DUF1232 domain-containing protein [Cyanobacteria bacterium Co-bin8]|nr:DUF1232 domain-containing protein [Cyanobacteria bacterium Co-bin8]